MVTQFEKRLLVNHNYDPLVVSEITGTPEQHCWEYLIEVDFSLRDLERTYREGSDQRRIDLEAFIDEIPNKQNIKRQSLLDRLQQAKHDNDLKAVKRLLVEFKSFMEPSTVIDTNSILRAKQYPITTLLNVHRVGNISCPFHPDKTPSFQITKKNTFTCHSCGVYGDVIDLYQKLHNVDFKTAVTALQ